MDNEKQIQRIEYMEKLLDENEKIVSELFNAIENFENQLSKINELSQYYESSDWRKDFEASEKRILPTDLKCGILSEDGIYNLLMDSDELKRKLNIK